MQLYLGQQQITRTDIPKILGLILDKRHTWSPSLKTLKTECCRRMNILKVIASKNWGTKFQILIKSYKAIETRGYGAIVYCSANPSTLKILKPGIHNTGARGMLHKFSNCNSMRSKFASIRHEKKTIKSILRSIETLNTVKSCLQDNNWHPARRFYKKAQRIKTFNHSAHKIPPKYWKIEMFLTLWRRQC